MSQLKLALIRVRPDDWKAMEQIAAAQGTTKTGLLRAWMARAVRTALRASR
jgi:hypothetical protein